MSFEEKSIEELARIAEVLEDGTSEEKIRAGKIREEVRSRIFSMTESGEIVSQEILQLLVNQANSLAKGDELAQKEAAGIQVMLRGMLLS